MPDEKEILQKAWEREEKLKMQRGMVPQFIVVDRHYEPSFDKATKVEISIPNSHKNLTIEGNSATNPTDKPLIARSSFGACAGCYYFEVQIRQASPKDKSSLGIGFATERAKNWLPVGINEFGYAYLCNACIVHDSGTQPFGETYAKGDVIGCLIRLPEENLRLSRPLPLQLENVHTTPAYNPPVEIPASIHFFKNGLHQGIAYQSVLSGTYYAAVTLGYNEKVDITFQEPFKFPPSNIDSFEPFSALANKPQACEAEPEPPFFYDGHQLRLTSLAKKIRLELTKDYIKNYITHENDQQLKADPTNENYHPPADSNNHDSHQKLSSSNHNFEKTEPEVHKNFVSLKSELPNGK